jgi:hypothetical protein
MIREPFDGKVGFVIGTGRCGTKFFSKVAGLEPHVASCHERNRLNETFHRYCQWYGLKVDHEGFLLQKEVEIRRDLAQHSFSLEASAYLSLSIEKLYQRFGAKFLLLTRSPERVVNSFSFKGWYSGPTVLGDRKLAPSYQPSISFHHFLARFNPTGDEFQDWNDMTRIGKLAWYWKAMNDQIINQFADLPDNHWRIEKIEGLSYDRYVDVATFLGYEVCVGREVFEQIAASRPNKFSDVPTIDSWREIEISEFEREVSSTAQKLGYEYHVSHLSPPRPRTIENSTKPFVKRLLNSIIRNA